MKNTAPEQWFTCDECCGEGEVHTGRMSHMVTSGTIDPPEEIMETCGECNGAGGWLDEAETN